MGVMDFIRSFFGGAADVAKAITKTDMQGHLDKLFTQVDRTESSVNNLNITFDKRARPINKKIVVTPILKLKPWLENFRAVRKELRKAHTEFRVARLNKDKVKNLGVMAGSISKAVENFKKIIINFDEIQVAIDEIDGKKYGIGKRLVSSEIIPILEITEEQINETLELLQNLSNEIKLKTSKLIFSGSKNKPIK